MNKLTLLAAVVTCSNALANPTALDRAFDHTLYIDADRNAYAMGDCRSGVCGLHSREAYNPEPVWTGVSNVKQISASDVRSAFVTDDNRAFVTRWFNSLDTTSTPEILEVTGLPSGAEIIDAELVVGALYLLVKSGEYTVDGQAYPRGQIYKAAEDFRGTDASATRVNSNANYIAISGGRLDGAALDMYGNAYTWGRDAKLSGTDAGTVAQELPSEPTLSGYGFRNISVSGKTTVAVDSNNQAWYWGVGYTGYRMDGVKALPESLTPAMMPGLDDVKRVYGSATGPHMMFTSMDDELRLVGWNNLFYEYDRRTIDGQYVAFYQDGLPLRATQVAEGFGDSTLYSDFSGQLWAASGNRYGKLGLGFLEDGSPDTMERHAFEPVVPPVLRGPTRVTQPETPVCDEDGNNGHGNDVSGVDCSNPGLAHRSDKAQGAAARAKSRQADLIAKQLEANLARKRK